MILGILSNSRLPLWLRLYLIVAIRHPGSAIAIAYWYVTKRRVRAANRLNQSVHPLIPAYLAWTMTVEHNEDSTFFSSAAARPIHFTIIVNAKRQSAAMLGRLLASISGQKHEDWDVILVGDNRPVDLGFNPNVRVQFVASTEPDDVEAYYRAIQMAAGAYLVLVPDGAILPRRALARYAEAAQTFANPTVLYGDEDRLDETGMRSDPWFKPQWNEELLLATDYISRACAISTKAAQTVPVLPKRISACAGYALVLGLARLPGFTACHLPHVLCHLAQDAARSAILAQCLAVAYWRGIDGVKASAGPFGTVVAAWPMPLNEPSVEIIIPTRDKLDLLAACVNSILAKTRYDNYRIMIIDNNSIEKRTLKWLGEISTNPRVSVLSYPEHYNYSAINNFGISQSLSRFVCLLNNDTEVISHDWLSELVRYAVQDDVGAVGAKLLYEDGHIQHAGVAIGLGNAAGHSHRGLNDSSPGYFAVPHCAHSVSAVTAACLLVSREKYISVGGLDDINLQIAYNDVDFCLKLQAKGWRNIYAPRAVLYHYESKSRGNDFSPNHLERYLSELSVLQSRWDTQTIVDPMHHVRLDRSSETYRLHI